MDYIQTLKEAIEDARCELEEAEESGDLEGRLELARHAADLEARLFRARLKSTGSA